MEIILKKGRTNKLNIVIKGKRGVRARRSFNFLTNSEIRAIGTVIVYVSKHLHKAHRAGERLLKLNKLSESEFMNLNRVPLLQHGDELRCQV